MRIAVLVNEFPAISETFVLDQITALIDAGHEVEIFAQRLHPELATHPEVAGYGLLQRARQVTRPEVGSKLERIELGLRDLWKACRVDARTALGTLDPRSAAMDALKLKTFYSAAPFLGRPAYDAVHCHFGPNGVLATRLRELGALRGPLVTQFHGYDASSYVREHGARVYARLLETGELFLAVSERIRNALLALGATPEKVRVHRTGVRVGELRFEVTPRTGESIELLGVGRFVEKKGFEFAIRALQALEQSGAEPTRYRLTLIGDGPLRPELEALAARLAVDVEFMGAQPREVVASAMHRSHVLVAPSVVARDGDEEGVPVVLMEAMARGVPVVSTEHAGIPELITHDVDGLLAPERDPAALARHLQRLARSDDERRRLATRARRTVEAEFDSVVQNRRLGQIYFEVNQAWRSGSQTAFEPGGTA